VNCPSCDGGLYVGCGVCNGHGCEVCEDTGDVLCPDCGGRLPAEAA